MPKSSRPGYTQRAAAAVQVAHRLVVDAADELRARTRHCLACPTRSAVTRHHERHSRPGRRSNRNFGPLVRHEPAGEQEELLALDVGIAAIEVDVDRRRDHVGRTAPPVRDPLGDLVAVRDQSLGTLRRVLVGAVLGARERREHRAPYDAARLLGPHVGVPHPTRR